MIQQGWADVREPITHGNWCASYLSPSYVGLPNFFGKPAFISLTERSIGARLCYRFTF